MITSKNQPLPRGLDAASRRVVARFCFAVSWFAIIALIPALTGLARATDAAAALGTYCAFAALLRVFIAGRRREKPFAASLTSWDESLALVGAAMLAYFAARMLA